MQKLINHLKTSGIGTMSGMSCYAGGQYLNTAIQDSVLKNIAIFGLFTALSVFSKLIVDHVAKKP